MKEYLDFACILDKDSEIYWEQKVGYSFRECDSFLIF